MAAAESGDVSVALMIETNGPGGAERMLLQLAEGLRARGHAVCPVLPAKGYGWLGSEFSKAGFDPEKFTLRRPLDWKCAQGLVEIFRRRRVRVVHSNEFTMGFYGAIAARWSGLPHVITMHGGTAFAQRWRRRVALRWAFRTSRAVVTVSQASRRQLSALLGVGEESIKVVPNGVAFTPGNRTRTRARLGVDAGEILILAVGNLYPVKGHIVLLRALASLDSAGRPWRLVIAGRGAEEATLRCFAETAGIAQRVQLLGYRDDVPDLLAAADIYAMPSLSEGLPLALVEAMFAAKPVVASRVGGIPEVIEHNATGLLVPVGDAKALARGLKCLLADPERARALGEAARETASSRYTLNRMVEAYRRLYEVAGGTKRP